MIAGALALALLAQAVPQEERPPDFPINIPLWPLSEHRVTDEGFRTHSDLLLYHVTLKPDGDVHSWHALNWIVSFRQACVARAGV